jgi:hypothetical protein
LTAGSRRQQTCHDKEPHQKTSAEPHLELLRHHKADRVTAEGISAKIQR